MVIFGVRTIYTLKVHVVTKTGAQNIVGMEADIAQPIYHPLLEMELWRHGYVQVKVDAVSELEFLKRQLSSSHIK